MSNEASFDGQSQEFLQALAKVVQICLPAWPCHRSTCKHCQKELAWQNAMKDADETFESQIWGHDA